MNEGKAQKGRKMYHRTARFSLFSLPKRKTETKEDKQRLSIKKKVLPSAHICSNTLTVSCLVQRIFFFTDKLSHMEGKEKEL